MNTVDFSTQIVDWDGRPMVDQAQIVCEHCGRQEPMKLLDLRTVCLTSLGRQTEDERRLEFKDRIARFKLGVKVHDAVEPIELMAEEVVLLKDLINRTYLSPVVVAQAAAMLEGQDAFADAWEGK